MRDITDINEHKIRKEALKHIGGNENIMMAMILELEKKIGMMDLEIEELKAKVNNR